MIDTSLVYLVFRNQPLLMAVYHPGNGNMSYASAWSLDGGQWHLFHNDEFDVNEATAFSEAEFIKQYGELPPLPAPPPAPPDPTEYFMKS